MALTPGAGYSPHGAVQESTAASIRLSSGGSDIACGQSVDAGSQLSLSFSSPTRQYLVEVVTSTSSSPLQGGRCSGTRLNNQVAAVTIPKDGTITVRAAWSSSRSSPIYRSADCVYTVKMPGCSTPGTYLDNGQCADCPAFSTSPAMSTSISACQCVSGYTPASSGTCNACPKGTYKSTVGSDACTECPAGSFSHTTAATAQTACTLCRDPCAAGEKEIVACTATTNRVCIPANCTACATGEYLTNCNSASSSGGTCVKCEKCNGGEYREGCAGISAGECKACTAGYYSTGAEYTDSCLPCSVCKSNEIAQGTCLVSDQVCTTTVAAKNITYDVVFTVQLPMSSGKFTQEMQKSFISAVTITVETVETNVKITKVSNLVSGTGQGSIIVECKVLCHDEGESKTGLPDAVLLSVGLTSSSSRLSSSWNLLVLAVSVVYATRMICNL
ncbi:hypothetical protein GUITHDRAFT_102717 [Guillardia theta CCMP2712]|uniref:TNFR-Cys domain-containing protein n=1 Tax=Guillardia theta (strain CCMP2712) TaxID=905079 RepID=L1JTC6_GUITC|nr:hypothetical protein GUITHDRAFT_102717 [Guillardia theta CCMP2712]EKX51450.1 hypothetical protein GUITHDRAFT_102717 [Guillardia theta CCMP2712]|eukprot:XP_005838430.1 hypothetical protein GUITHDRAFT_102717 [Guillardia theta CCMP2712]